jgi:hypothetical protein
LKFEIMSLAVTNLESMEMDDHNCCDVTVDVESCPITCHETPACKCSIETNCGACTGWTNCGSPSERPAEETPESVLMERELEELKELIGG